MKFKNTIVLSMATTMLMLTINNINVNAMQKSDQVYVSSMGEPSGDFEEIIDIPDLNLLQAIKEKLMKIGVMSNQNKPINRQMMEKLEGLTIANKRIKNLKGLEYAINITTLDVSCNQIEDMSPLKYLSQITYLNCSCNPNITRIQLAGLADITYLDCSFTGINSLDLLAGAADLEFLDCQNTKIDNIEFALRTLSLQHLNCSHTDIENLDDLKNLEYLHVLNCSHTKIKNINILTRLRNLQSLDCSSTLIDEIPDCSNLSQLTEIKFSNTQIKILFKLFDFKIPFEVSYDNNITKLKIIKNGQPLVGEQREILSSNDSINPTVKSKPKIRIISIIENTPVNPQYEKSGNQVKPLSLPIQSQEILLKPDQAFDQTFKELNTLFATQGIFVHWFNDPDAEIAYLEKTEPLKEKNLQKFRRSKRHIKSMLNEVKHWNESAKQKLQKFAEAPSDSESEENLKGDKYTGPTPFTLLLQGHKIDDYRYSTKNEGKELIIKDNGIGIVVAMPAQMKIPGIMQYLGKSGYSEFLDTGKIKHNNIVSRKFDLDLEERGNPPAKLYKDYNQAEAKKKVEQEIDKWVNNMRSQYSYYSEEHIKNKFYIPYNEALFRYQAKHIKAILVNCNENGEIYQESAKKAIEMYRKIKKTGADFQPIFCKNIRKSGKLENVTEEVLKYM